MSVAEAVLLAIVQGLTEFLPVSSSGHLALVEHWLGLSEMMRLPVSVALHFGTWLALLIYFRQELLLMLQGIVAGDAEGRRLLGYVALANGATVALALPLKASVERVFESPHFIALFLALTSLLLFTSEWRAMQAGKGDQPLNWRRALLVGIAQGIAVFPGLSRSGTTIAAGLFCGLARERAGRFAFVISIPAMLGANVLEAKNITALPIGIGGLLIAVAFAFATGYLAIHWALLTVQRLQLRWFGLYCLLVASVALVS